MSIKIDLKEEKQALDTHYNYSGCLKCTILPKPVAYFVGRIYCLSVFFYHNINRAK